MSTEQLKEYLQNINELAKAMRAGMARPIAVGPTIEGEVVGTKNDRDPGDAV